MSEIKELREDLDRITDSRDYWRGAEDKVQKAAQSLQKQNERLCSEGRTLFEYGYMSAIEEWAHQNSDDTEIETAMHRAWVTRHLDETVSTRQPKPIPRGGNKTGSV